MQYNPTPNPNLNPNPNFNSQPMPTNEEKNWAMFCHLSALGGYIGIPYANIAGPLIVWLIKKNESAYVDRHGKESLNFHISLAIYQTIAFILIFAIVGLFLLPLVCVLGIVCTIVGAIKASNGEHYLYPLAIPFIR